jgi:hypothetical protein
LRWSKKGRKFVRIGVDEEVTSPTELGTVGALALPVE